MHYVGSEVPMHCNGNLEELDEDVGVTLEVAVLQRSYRKDDDVHWMMMQRMMVEAGLDGLG
jgi:hypothetical protein